MFQGITSGVVSLDAKGTANRTAAKGQSECILLQKPEKKYNCVEVARKRVMFLFGGKGEEIQSRKMQGWKTDCKKAFHAAHLQLPLTSLRHGC